MDKQTDRESNRRGFFDRPASVDFWLSVGARFWGGLLMGLGFGQFIGASLIKEELIPPKSGFWFVTWLVLFFIGFVITHRAVGRSAAPEIDPSET